MNDDSSGNKEVDEIKPEQTNKTEGNSSKFAPDERKRLLFRLSIAGVIALLIAGAVTAIVVVTTGNDSGDSNKDSEANSNSLGSNGTSGSGGISNSTATPSVVVSPTPTPALSPSQTITQEEPSLSPSFGTFPTFSPTVFPTEYPTRGETIFPFCTNDFECLTDGLGQGHADRHGNQSPLRAGRALCSKGGYRYAFGLSYEGALMWVDCQNRGRTIEFFSPNADAVGVEDWYFWLETNGTIQVRNKDGGVEWERQSRDEMFLWDGCLGNPYYDCPYFHLHRDGVCVLNWIDAYNFSWREVNMKRVYDF